MCATHGCLNEANPSSLLCTAVLTDKATLAAPWPRREAGEGGWRCSQSGGKILLVCTTQLAATGSAIIEYREMTPAGKKFACRFNSSVSMTQITPPCRFYASFPARN